MAENTTKLTLIAPEPGPDPLQPPGGLQETGRGLWNRILRDFEVNDAHGREALFRFAWPATAPRNVRRQSPAMAQ
jgi:hypothetical protein